MNEITTVSAKISKETRRKLELFHIPVSEVIRDALEREIQKKEEELIAGSLEEAKTILRRVPKEQIAAIIREDRDR